MKKKVISGSHILIKAALDAKVEFFAGYPITPAAKILTYFAQEAEHNNALTCFQTEDEIAAIHSVIGASLGGKKAMTATSGPGFTLMQEGLGLAFAASVPLVVVNVMRQGPSTGMSTKPAQGDILQTQYGTHGDYKSIVFYPSSVEEIYTYTLHACNVAEEARSPVILLIDGILANLSETIDFPLKKSLRIKEHTLEFGQAQRHLSGLVTDHEGIPQTSNATTCSTWLEEKWNRIETAAKNYQFFEYSEKKHADTLIIAFGPVARLLPQDLDFSIFQPITMFPICQKLQEIASRYKHILVIEMNKGQYAFALQAFLQREVMPISILGGEIYPEKITHMINERQKYS